MGKNRRRRFLQSPASFPAAKSVVFAACRRATWACGPASRCLRSRNNAAPADAVLVVRPLRLVLAPELVEVGPRVEAGVVAVVEDEAHGVLADRFDGLNADMLFPEHEHFLPGAMPLHFRRWRM